MAISLGASYNSTAWECQKHCLIINPVLYSKVRQQEVVKSPREPSLNMYFCTLRVVCARDPWLRKAHATLPAGMHPLAKVDLHFNQVTLTWVLEHYSIPGNQKTKHSRV